VTGRHQSTDNAPTIGGQDDLAPALGGDKAPQAVVSIAATTVRGQVVTAEVMRLDGQHVEFTLAAPPPGASAARVYVGGRLLGEVAFNGRELLLDDPAYFGESVEATYQHRDGYHFNLTQAPRPNRAARRRRQRDPRHREPGDN
jgi:hypothetical protein